MITYQARDIVNMPKEVAMSLPLEHSIVFEDGEVVNDILRNETLFTWLFWQIFRTYRSTRILSKHHVAKILKGGSLNTDTHAKLCSNILKSVVEDEGLFYPHQKEPLLELIYKTISDAMGEVSLMSEEAVTSIDILDFIQVAHHPVVGTLKEQAHKDPRSARRVCPPPRRRDRYRSRPGGPRKPFAPVCR